MATREIQPSVAALDIVCAETAAPPTAVIVFGASGDLVRRKLLPSLLQIQERGLLSDRFCLLGCGRTAYSDEQFRQIAGAGIGESAASAAADSAAAFLEKLYYVSGDYANPRTYESIKTRLTELRARHNIDGCNVFYLSVPPSLYDPIIEHLGAAGLPSGWPSSPSPTRLALKPHRYDLGLVD